MRILRKILLALLLSLLFGFALGTILRLRLERPIWYLAENFLAGEERLQSRVSHSGSRS